MNGAPANRAAAAPGTARGYGPGKVRSVRGLRNVAFALLAFLLLTAFFRPTYEVINLLSNEPAMDLALEPVHPVFRALTEPFSGPLTVLLGLPFGRVLSWAVWIFVLTVVVRTARARWAGRRLSGLLHEIIAFVGWCFPLAVLPAALYWAGILSKTAMNKLTPVGLPAIVLLLLTARVLWRSPGGERWRRWRRSANRFVGTFGWVGIILAIVIVTPGLEPTGHRLVAGDDVYIADFHAHADLDRDSLRGADTKLALFDRQGIRISAVTEHNDRPPWNPDFPTIEVQRELVRRNGYDMLLLSGHEITTHALHLVLLGSDGGYDRADYRAGDSYDFERMIGNLHADGRRVIVGHWWTYLTYHRIDWRDLIDWGVDGFEIAWNGERAPRELVEAWKAAGMLLVTASDYHGYRKTLYSWNLLDRETFNPDGVPLAELDEHEVIETMFAEPDKVRPVAAEMYLDSVPAMLEPPVGVWRYFCRLSLPGRFSWGVFVLLLWGACSFSARTRAVRRRSLRF